jgi:hypothetical protein
LPRSNFRGVTKGSSDAAQGSTTAIRSSCTGCAFRSKKARYATEFFSGLYHGKKSAKQRKKMKSSLMQLQGCLGRLNDIVTHKALFVDIIDNHAKGLTEEQSRHRAFAAGLIIGDQQAQIQQLLDRARKAHSRFERAKVFWKPPSRRGTAAAPTTEQPL